MTKEGIDYNFKRLAIFMDVEDPFIMGIGDPVEFLNGYARIMDYCGASIAAFSTLFLTKDDFKELNQATTTFEQYIDHPEYGSFNLPSGPAVFRAAYFRFNYCGYQWMVKEIKQYPIIEIKIS